MNKVKLTLKLKPVTKRPKFKNPLARKRKAKAEPGDVLSSSGKKRRVPKLPGSVKKDPFGNILFLKGALISAFGLITYSRYNIINRMSVKGAEHLTKLPKNNVLFISNHQTYYADVIALYHIFNATKIGLRNINFPFYVFFPRVNAYYVAAEETMKKSGILPKVFSYAGAVTVRRSWRRAGQDMAGNSDIQAPAKIKKALEHGWVVTFPQGTTKAFAPVRKGTANLVKAYKPTVVPVQINGFRRAFDRKGLFLKKRGVQLSVEFSEPVTFSENESIEEIQEFIRKSILTGDNKK